MRENKKIIIGDIIEVSKTPDKFFKVKFYYDCGTVWDGALPIYLRYQGFDLTESYETYEEYASKHYNYLSPKSTVLWDKKYLDPILKTNEFGPDTTKVLNALRSGKWECRVCGPVPKANAQPAARIRVLKQKGYCIATESIQCSNCNKKTHHDILVKIPIFDKSQVVKRYSIAPNLMKKIYTVFEYQEAYFSRVESPRNLIVDHKFPSDRWESGETVNHTNMSEDEIKDKFQLLTNQTNMMKSRACFDCVKTGKRGTYTGIKWYYHGDENWNGKDMYDEAGCYGCPWYDLLEWKKQLQNQLDILENKTNI